MEAEQVALGPDDYQALYGMFVSPDAAVRADAAGLAKKLTPDESKQFYDFQQQLHKGKTATETTRPDRQVMTGVDPELVVGAGAAAVRAIGSGVMAAARAAAASAAPVVKAEVARRTLEALGVPGPAASIAAEWIAMRGGKASPAAAESAAAESVPAVSEGPHLPSPTEMSPRDFTRALKNKSVTSPVESVSGETAPLNGPPASPTSPGESPAAAPTGKSPQQILNEEAIARRRAAYQAQQAEAPPVLAENMSAAEHQAYTRFRVEGLTDAAARQKILDSRRAAMEMNQAMGLKTPTEAETKFPKGQRGKAPAPKGSGS